MGNSSSPSAAQIRAAMAILRWENRDLSQPAGISVETVMNVKMGHSQPQPRIRDKIRTTLEAQGIEFLPDDGVKRSHGTITRLEGRDALARFFDDVYDTVKEGGDVCVSGVNEKLFAEFNVDEKSAAKHRARMSEIKDKLNFRALLKEGDYYFRNDSYIKYLWVPRDFFFEHPIYLYNNKLAFIKFDNDNFEILCISLPTMAAAFRAQFEFMWAHAKAPPTRKCE